MTVADALELSALPDHLRVHIAREIRAAYLEGFNDAHDLRDRKTEWTHILDEQMADSYHTSEVQSLIAVDVQQIQSSDAYIGGGR